MKTLSIAWKDMQMFLKDRGEVISLLLLPLVFVVVFTGTLGGVGQGEADTRIALPVVNLDGGESAQMLLDKIDEAMQRIGKFLNIIGT